VLAACWLQGLLPCLLLYCNIQWPTVVSLWCLQMEWVDGEIWANVWQTECIARISPVDGAVVGWINLGGLLERERQAHPHARLDVMNGAPPPRFLLAPQPSQPRLTS